MLPLFVRLGGDEAAAAAGEGRIAAEPAVALPSDLTGDDVRVTDASTVSLSRKGPFLSFADALRGNGALRDRFAESLELPAWLEYRRWRAWMFLGHVPLVMLGELDRELGAAGVPGAWARMAVDLFLLAVTALDLARKTPRHPRTTAIVFAGAAVRYVYLLVRSCGRGASPVLLAAPVVALAAAALVSWKSPPPREIVAQSLSRVGLRAPDGRAESAASGRELLLVSVAAIGLPIVLAVARGSGIGIWPQGALFVAYGALVPAAMTRLLKFRADVPTAFRVGLGIAMGLALTVGLTNLVHYGVDASAYVARCLDPAGFERSAARKLLAAENREVMRGIQEAREKWAYLLMTVLVVPLVEERVYRGLLQRRLASRFGSWRAIVVASGVFALAHLGVYRVALYQTILLGIAFGVAFEEGGIIAAVIVHGLWNAYLLL